MFKLATLFSLIFRLYVRFSVAKMRDLRIWLALGACVYLVTAVEGRKQLKRDQLESLKSAESDDDVEYDDVSKLVRS